MEAAPPLQPGGTWDKIHQALLARATGPERSGVEWTVSVDSTINRAHQHATNMPWEKPAAKDGDSEQDRTRPRR
ncbi:hypothetical protein GCM10011366_18970 [Ornithinimicrobium tianjinense]|uniref:Transposase n=1 Tax=Ornithinimicrobium tianjinense TaxID=1195761 RepID=A0A917BM90_9MICO|nr:hypothetical protein GCM10011366_18970 [Ornithinimicrobium tianjinense]